MEFSFQPSESFVFSLFLKKKKENYEIGATEQAHVVGMNQENANSVRNRKAPFQDCEVFNG